jgi:hypothetical protein
MDKLLDKKKIASRNKAVKLKDVNAGLELVGKLREMGRKPKEYALVVPYTRSMANRKDGTND